MNPYRLSGGSRRQRNASVLVALRRLAPVMADQKREHCRRVRRDDRRVGRVADRTVHHRPHRGHLHPERRLPRRAPCRPELLLLAYLAGLVATYVQTLQMGMVGRRVLFNLRNAIFTKLQQLPLDFFNQNKAGDLISRINNDTDKLNVFLAQALVQLAANLFLMAGAAVFLVVVEPAPRPCGAGAGGRGIRHHRATGSFVKARNAASLQSLGALSGDIQESMSNFRVIVAFNRVDYFRQQFAGANDRNYTASVRAGTGQHLLRAALRPRLQQRAADRARLQLLPDSAPGSFTVGLLIGFLLYVNSFYLPLRQLAAVWSSFQLAMASFDRISDVLALEPNLPQLPPEPALADAAVLAFDHVHFEYVEGSPCCATRPSRSSTARPTRWSDRPAAARRRPHP